VRAIVLTHAHPDHIGAAERLRADRGIPVRLLDTEAPHARGQVIQEAPARRVLRAAWRPQVLLWVLPGHGPAYRGSPASAVQRALAVHR
jgi:glyoxylase-like metal-dependent hydrolase (beta-lactamase superfamily II)